MLFGPLEPGPCPESDDDWSRLYDFYAGLVLKFITNKGYNHDLAQDVLQETMLCLWKKLQELRNQPEAEKSKMETKSMILTMAHSRLVDLQRKNFRYVELDIEKQDHLLTEDKVNWDREFEEKIRDEIISKLKNSLDELQYDVFKSMILKSGKVAEVAERLGLEPRQISDVKYEINQLIQRESKKLRRRYDP